MEPGFRFNESDPINSVLSFVEEGDNDCWIWRGKVHKEGYGIFYSHSRTVLVHKFLWEALKEKVERGFRLMQSPKCKGNKLCCNPDHWRKVPKNNDGEKGSLYSIYRKEGSSNYAAKLTANDVRNIKREYGRRVKENEFAYQKITMRYLARRYQVSQTTIWLIVTGRIWKHIN